MQATDFEKFIAKEVAGHEFQPFARYDAEGDCIRFLTAPDEYYRERIDDILTAYISFKTKAVIGGQIKGIAALKKSSPAVHNYFFHRGEERLDVIIIAVASVIKEPIDPAQFRRFIDAARVVAELNPVVRLREGVPV